MLYVHVIVIVGAITNNNKDIKMMAYEMAAVIEHKDYYEVEYLTSSITKDYNRSSKFIGLSNSAAKIIKGTIENGNLVKIIKNYQDVDVQPRDLIIDKNEESDLDKHKEIIATMARQYVSHQQANVSGMMMYDFININNYLASKGFFIHDDNREIVYLEILETEDEEIIDKLEQYLSARDELAHSSYLETEYTKLYKNLRSAETMDEVDETYDEFIKHNSNSTTQKIVKN